MTEQIRDSVRHKKAEYYILTQSADSLFMPKEHGLALCFSGSTACYNGYYCEYIIVDGQLFLQNLFTHANTYPALNGVNATIAYEEYYEYRMGQKEKVKVESEFREYRDLNIPIHYTGILLLGKDFNRDTYMRYNKLIELKFVEGKLIEETDESEWAKRMKDSLINLDETSLKRLGYGTIFNGIKPINKIDGNAIIGDFAAT